MILITEKLQAINRLLNRIALLLIRQINLIIDIAILQIPSKMLFSSRLLPASFMSAVAIDVQTKFNHKKKLPSTLGRAAAQKITWDCCWFLRKFNKSRRHHSSRINLQSSMMEKVFRENLQSILVFTDFFLIYLKYLITKNYFQIKYQEFSTVHNVTFFFSVIILSSKVNGKLSTKVKHMHKNFLPVPALCWQRKDISLFLPRAYERKCPCQ